ncbi:hypothetical protein HDE_02112 [Halotydeus destructor]|nr:hypothetical protein HDE_02112 [Halotydeus destructor]
MFHLKIRLEETMSPFLLEAYHNEMKQDGDQAGWWPPREGLGRLAFRAAILMVCLAACCGQCVSILSMYYAYPTTVFVYMETMDNLETPGVTICNNNRLALSKLMAFNDTFANQWNLIADMRRRGQNNSGLDLRLQTLIDETTRDMMTSLSVKSFLSIGHYHEDFILDDDFRCASDNANATVTPCRTFANVITTAQNSGNCFTMFHHAYKKLSNMASIKSGYSAAPVAVRGTTHVFRPNEMLRMKLNFTRDEYTTLDYPVSGSVVIHDTNMAPTIRFKSIQLLPGHFYELFITKTTSDLLPAPYLTDCMNYVHKYRGHYDMFSSDEESDDMVYKYPLSKEDCIIGCMGLNTVRRCKCYPPELPFVLAKRSEDKIRWCDWDSTDDLESAPRDNLTKFDFCFSSHEEFCNQYCKLDCRVDRYQIIKESREWPSAELIAHSHGKERMLEDKACCAIVSVRFWSTEHTIYKYKAKFEPIELMSYLSGLVSMWLGFSALAFFNVLEQIFEQCFKWFWRHSRSSKIPSVRERSRRRFRAVTTAVRAASRRAKARGPSLDDAPYTVYIPEVRYIRPIYQR